MKNVVVIDRGDYWEIFGDYSGSPRHAALTEPQWKAEYQNHPSYAAMRASQLGSFAIAAPVGAGKWLKDWSRRYVPPKT
jgi:hypothetical protein